MSIFKWIGAEKLDPFFKGEFDCTLGGSLNAVYGARHVHTIGERCALTISPWSLLRLRALGSTYPALASIFTGVSGDSRFVVGNDTGVTYKGPVWRIHRAETPDRLMPPILKDPKQTLEEIELGTETTIDPADVALEEAIITMVRLTSAITVLFELSIHFAYPQYGETGDGGDTVPTIIETLGEVIVSRLLAIMTWMEKAGGDSQFSLERMEQSAYEGQKFIATNIFALWGDEVTALTQATKTTLRETWTTVRASVTAERAMLAMGIVYLVGLAAAAVAVGVTQSEK